MPHRKDSPSDRQGQKEKPQPVESFRYPSSGGTLEVSIWENLVEGKNGERVAHSVTIRRSYHDGKGWKESKSLFPQDLPVLVLALQEAFRAICNLHNKK